MPASFSGFVDREAADLAACRALLRTGSRTFFAASLILPADIRNPASALYAFCRLADDAVDLENASSADTIAHLRARLTLAYEGRPLDHPADRAFAATVARFNIPRTLPEALIEGFVWDGAGRRYETLPDLLAYAARVAGSVGAMMALVMGVKSAGIAARACDLGMAMQLSNIARDVGEDARTGRLYLPMQWLREAGVDPDGWLAKPVFNDALACVIARLLAEAERLYERAEPGIAGLPLTCRPGIRAARYLYAEIGHEVARRGYDSVSSRAVVPLGRKLSVMGRSLVGRRSVLGETLAMAADEARFLIDAVSYAIATARKDRSAPWWNLDSRIAWLVDLFERLDRQDKARLAGSPPENAQVGYR
jgi:phytoene synthase